ncbi:hypothetical protein AB0P21_09835 [Kribbella sp. NPDC056861]|uniref:hypothetical protein n=1 Tax=Kribbella sp. NPDC056861 TaxID=3154857 RepID=UPI003435456E
MRRAYISPHIDLPESFDLARVWAGGDKVTIIGPSTADIDASPFLAKAGLPIGITGHRHTRYTARARTGVVIAWCLHLDEILGIERESGLDGLVAVRGFEIHAPWITAHDAELLDGEPVPQVPEASSAIKAMVRGISQLVAVPNQGLIDPRERSSAVHALVYMRSHGHQLIPEQLAVEAIRNEWPGKSPLDLADLAKQLNAGKQLRYDKRLSSTVLAEWAAS